MNAKLVGARLGTGVACAVCCGLPMLVVAGVVTVSARRGVVLAAAALLAANRDGRPRGSTASRWRQESAERSHVGMVAGEHEDGADEKAHNHPLTLETPVGACTYELQIEPFVVSPSQTHVVDNTPAEARLTLTTCHPKGSARQRLSVTATMVGAETIDA